MKANNYIFTYRSHLDYKEYWQRHYCETPEDIIKVRDRISRDHGQVEEIDEEINEQEYENQEA